jgi:hypothetical protein
MAGVYKLATETEADLKQRLRGQKTASDTDKERIQLLYLLKTKQETTIQSTATLLGRHRVTVQEWGSAALVVSKPCSPTNPVPDDGRAFPVGTGGT